MDKNKRMISLIEIAKFYVSLCLGTVAFISVFTFLFLIPFVVDPAITSLMANYDPEPVTCIVTQHIYAEGLRNCMWSSCREGCTSQITKCHQILVNYSEIPFRQRKSIYDGQWNVVNTRLLINAEGCGYPPTVNCSQFAHQYGYDSAGTPFPCHYSRVYPHIVIARYSWDETLRQLLLSIAIPNLLFAASIAILTYWYCSGCGRSCNKYIHHFPAE